MGTWLNNWITNNEFVQVYFNKIIYLLCFFTFDFNLFRFLYLCNPSHLRGESVNLDISLLANIQILSLGLRTILLRVSSIRDSKKEGQLPTVLLCDTIESSVIHAESSASVVLLHQHDCWVPWTCRWFDNSVSFQLF